jgi:hypothetical protein
LFPKFLRFFSSCSSESRSSLWRAAYIRTVRQKSNETKRRLHFLPNLFFQNRSHYLYTSNSTIVQNNEKPGV